MNNSSIFIRKVYKRFYISTVIMFLLRTSVQFIGVFLAGNMLGATALGTAGLLMPISFLYLALGGLFEIGGSTLCSRYIGENDFESAKKVVSIAYLANLLICALVAVLGFLFMSDILRLLNIPAAMLGEAKIYVGVLLLCGPFASAVPIGSGLLKFDGNMTAITAVTAIAPVCALTLAYALIRYAGCGVSAVAIGINAGYALTSLIMLYMVAKKTKVLGFARVTAAEFVKLFALTAKNGLVSSTNEILAMIIAIIINGLIITTYGQLALSAYSAFASLLELFTAVALGSALAFVPLAGVMNSERDSASVKQLLKISLIYGFALALITGVGVLALSKPIAAGFGLGFGEGYEMIRRFLLVMVVANALEVLLNTILFLHNTLGRYVASTVFVVCKKALLVPLFILAGSWGFAGASQAFWLCFALTIVAALVYGLVASGRNKYLTKVFLIDTEAEKNGTYISFSVENSIGSIVESSQKIDAFCRQNQLGASRSNLLALAIEEMLLLIREYSLKDGREPMNVRILLYQHQVILRVRNNGELFNPLAFYRDLHLSDQLTLGDALAHQEFLGMKMVVDTAKDVDYRRTFGVNNLTVTI